MGVLGQVKRRGKKVLAGSLYHAGALDVVRRRTMKGSAVVLLYHRIVDGPSELDDYSPSGMTVRADRFDAQMAYLKRHYDVVKLSEIADHVVNRRPLRDRLCAVTFDDGWRDNYTRAFPILKRHGMPATIFLAINFIEGRPWFWEERFKYVLAHLAQLGRAGLVAPDDVEPLQRMLARHSLDAALAMPLPELTRFLTAQVNRFRQTSDDERGWMMGDLEELLSRESLREPRRFMTWDEIREMEAAGIEFAAHTLSHVNLERCDEATAAVEIRGSAEATTLRLRQPLRCFAYPFGKHTPAVRSTVQDAGFGAAFTTRPGFVTGESNPMELCRIDINDNIAPSLPLFASRALHLMGVY